jgi:alpha-2-macroglobulin
MNRIEYSVAGAGNVARSLERNAELQLTLNKKDYAPGEDIEISVRAPYTGAGLITIERDHVYAHQWFKANTLASVQKIRVPKDFEGNGYVSVQFIRDPASDEIFTSPLSFGVVPFMTSLAARTNILTLSAPELVKPGQILKIKLTAAQPTRAVVFAVDEGILQVARYQMADPLGYFYKKRALEVSTSQILDLILPEFRKLMSAAAPGGDAEGLLGRNLNPFKRKRDKPVAYWSGLVDVTGEREFTYEVPDTFNGTLRLMAVTANDGAIGTAQAKSVVRGDFVLTPNLPLAVAPGDEFEVSVGVANNIAGSGKEPEVSVAMKASAAFEQIGNATQALKIAEMRESVAVFRLKAKDGDNARLGSATLSFSATLGGKAAKLSQDISVRPATPHYTQVSAGSYKSSIDVPLKRKLLNEFREVEASTSPVPLVLAGGLSIYLASFEHACTEQLVSQAMPAVILSKRPDFAASPRRKSASISPPAKSLDDMIRVLRARQNAEGGFGLWTASVQADEFATVYANHLLLEARERGDTVPVDLVKKGTEYLQQLASSPAGDLQQARVRAYAAYLLTRMGVVTTPYLTAVREMLETRYPKEWKQDLAAAYLAASHQMLKQETLAESMIDPLVDLLIKDTTEFPAQRYYDPLVRSTQTLYLLARHFPKRAKALPAKVFESIVKTLQANRFNTLSAAYTILALDAYASSVGDANAKLAIAEIGADGKEKALPLSGQLIARVEVPGSTEKLRFSNAADITTWFVLTESGFDRAPPVEELKAGIELIREYLGADGKPVTSVRLGDEITVRLRVRAIGRDFVPNIALVDLLPGGFEPVLNAAGSDGDAEPAGRIGRGSWHTEYADIREDRVVLYGSAGRDVAEFSYRIKATNSGSFIVPPAWVESLYERDIQGRAAAGRITVERATSK